MLLAAFVGPTRRQTRMLPAHDTTSSSYRTAVVIMVAVGRGSCDAVLVKSSTVCLIRYLIPPARLLFWKLNKTRLLPPLPFSSSPSVFICPCGCLLPRILQVYVRGA